MTLLTAEFFRAFQSLDPLGELFHSSNPLIGQGTTREAVGRGYALLCDLRLVTDISESISVRHAKKCLAFKTE